MNTRAAIVELLHAGHSNKAIARHVHIRASSVREVRDHLGLPPHRPGPTPSSAEDHLWRRAIPTDDGHLDWPATDPRIRTGHQGERRRAGQIAFRIGNGRDPVGKVTAGCDHPGCIHPQHVEDEPMRQQYAAIFGKAAA